MQPSLPLGEREYHPLMTVGWGPSVWREMWRELLESRGLTWRLVLRDVSARYRQSVLGIVWALILPLIAIGTFLFLSRTGLFNVGETEVPYVAFALVGVTLWQIFAGGLPLCANSIVTAGSMVARINFPKECLVLAALGQTMIDLMLRTALVAAVFVLYQVTPAVTVILLPLAVLPIIFLTLGVGFVLSMLNALARDIEKVLAPLLNFLLFATPVLYPAPESGVFAAVNRWNPLAILIDGARDLVIAGHISSPGRYAAAAGLSLVVFALGWRVFHLVEPRMAERV